MFFSRTFLHFLSHDMKICLKTYAKQDEEKAVVIELQDRLPAHIHSPAELHCKFRIKSQDDYYLMSMDVIGDLNLTCQRCLQPFSYHHVNHTELAICATNAISERLMNYYECILATSYQVELTDILTDEVYLYIPENHSAPAHCDGEINKFIGNNG